MQSPNLLTEENKDKGPQKMGYQVQLHPWMPLTTDEEIPVPADWCYNYKSNRKIKTKCTLKML
jgi:hypothetical protein